MDFDVTLCFFWRRDRKCTSKSISSVYYCLKAQMSSNKIAAKPQNFLFTPSNQFSIPFRNSKCEKNIGKKHESFFSTSLLVGLQPQMWGNKITLSSQKKANWDMKVQNSFRLLWVLRKRSTGMLKLRILLDRQHKKRGKLKLKFNSSFF